MSVLAFTLVAAGAGIAGFAIGKLHEHTAREEYVAVCLEEGFRTFIEHYIEDVDRDSEEADRLWEQSVSKKRTEMLARQFAGR